MLDTQLLKTFRGTWEEIISHKNEIPPDTVLELNVYEQKSAADESEGAFGGKSVAEVMAEIGFVDGLPSNLSERAEEYLAESELCVTKHLRTFES